MIQQFRMCQENLMICRSILISSLFSTSLGQHFRKDRLLKYHFDIVRIVRWWEELTLQYSSSCCVEGFTNINVNENICNFSWLAWSTKRHFFVTALEQNKTLRPSGRKRPSHIDHISDFGPGSRMACITINKGSWEIWDHAVNSFFLDHLANILSTMNNLSFFPAERLSSRWIYYWQGGYRPCLTPRGWRISLHLLTELTDHKSFGSDLSLYYSHHQGE